MHLHFKGPLKQSTQQQKKKKKKKKNRPTLCPNSTECCPNIARSLPELVTLTPPPPPPPPISYAYAYHKFIFPLSCHSDIDECMASPCSIMERV